MLIEKEDLKRAKKFAGMIENSMEQNYQLGRIRFLQGNEKADLRHWNAVLITGLFFGKTMTEKE